ncbi:UDP-forming cellulose synthase catalytic subunit [Herbaspirillum sp. YR522]|uniref:UDP-forming cellulose synthase catalytic subunit n=1 Tax=Herbaspirillum sp. YR522 TaxID=1144342 RepID=UPI00026F4A2E|nr:UDP-forming cellulose synthase catalytic subunit [Herbaspirillum sp. YR522]EJN10291.1 cellulose synthase catalytic subunit (UDP-forming) [Herbaspirillum sp. YR522]
MNRQHTDQPDLPATPAGHAGSLAARAAIGALWLAVALVLLAAITVRVDLAAQGVMAGSAVALMLLMRSFGYVRRLRVFFLLVSSFLLLRYLWWRTFNTLAYDNVADFVFMAMLYLAEVYGISVALLSFFVNVHPLKRDPVPLDLRPGKLLTVDVLIPTYNEPTELLEITLRAALDMRYPQASHVRVYLLDDGGTLQKRTQASPAKAAEARQRHIDLQALARRHGARYLTRDKNLNAKAGNVNEALSHCIGDLVLILDADHVPTVDFLEKTVGFFQQDEKLYLVQTPHFFINPDPVEKNLDMFGRMPPENEMFYAVIQRGLDFWDGAYFCGSAAVIRRSHLDEVGGIGGVSITEDAETAMKLHAKGYRSAYLNEPLISGLQPETFSSFIVQRLRWAQGMVQLFLLRNVFTMKGLTIPQKLCYFSNTFYWFFSYARVMLLLAPMAYLVLGLRFYNASIPEFFAYGLPAMVGAILTSDYLFGRYRWTLISELYEMLQSLFSLQAILMVIRNPRAPSFNVTPKGEHLEHDTVSQLAGPFYFVYAMVVLTMVVGLFKLAHANEHQDVIISALCWDLLNLIILNACIGVLYERKQRRASPRVPVNLNAEVALQREDDAGVTERLDPRHSAEIERVLDDPLPCRVVDISSGGAQLQFAIELAGQVNLRMNRLRVYNHALGHDSLVPIAVRSSFTSKDKKRFLVGVQFTDRSVAGLSETVSLASGDSERWSRYRAHRNQRLGILGGIVLLVRLGTVHVSAQYYLFCKGMLAYLHRRLVAPLLATRFVASLPYRLKRFYRYLIN